MKKVIVFCLALLSLPSLSAIINVDGKSCGIRDAINAAHLDSAVGGCSAGSPGEDVLNLNPNTVFSISDLDPQSNIFGLVIGFFNDVTIEGNGSVIERASSGPEFGLLKIDNASVTINNLTIRNGLNPTDLGGGIQVLGTRAQLVLNYVNVIDNVGGGLLITNTSTTSGRLLHEINNSRFANNSGAPNSKFSNGLGGAGIGLVKIRAVVKNSTIDSNHASAIGGGIGLFQAELLLINSTVSGNVADGSGGGIAVRGDNNILKIIGSTVSNNTSLNIGGGINFNADDNASVAPNNFFRIDSSLISDNMASNGANEINGPVDQAVLLNGGNIIGKDDLSGSENIVLGFSDLVPSQPIEQIILPLNSKSDFQKIHQLVENSPAIDFASNPCVDDFDQIGNNRPLDGNNDGSFSCDAGSVEYVYDVIFINGFQM